MSFNFAEKTEKLNWQQISDADVNNIILRNNIEELEYVLQNVQSASLSSSDLRRIGNPDLIKLFKVG
jgi:hypothetical protein